MNNNTSNPAVAIVGGGVAGIAAALRCARAGVPTLLIERREALGGMASNAFVHTLCGLFRLRDSENEPLQYVNPGIPIEIAERLLATGGASAPVRMGRLDVMPHRPLALAREALRLVQAEDCLELCLHTEVVAVISDAQRSIRSLRVCRQGREETWEVAAVVDASGDGAVAALAGADFSMTEASKLQRPAYIFMLGGVDPQLLSGDNRVRLALRMVSAISSGELPSTAMGCSFRAGVGEEVWGSIDLQADPLDPLSRECLSRIEQEGRECAYRIVEFLRQQVEGFEGALVAATPEQVGIRESRRVLGEEYLTEADILEGKDFEDSIAYAAWPLELRENAKGPKFRFPQQNRSAGIRRGCLRSRSFRNLLVAGRCISCSHEAQAAIRVTGTCMATGEAAGAMAAELR